MPATAEIAANPFPKWIRHRIGKIADEVFIKRASLKPFDYEKGGLIAAMQRQELRAMSPEDRAAAMRRFDFRNAALEQPPELSTIPPSLHKHLAEEEVAARFPDEVAGTSEATEAAELVRAALKTANAAVENELLASGTTVAEPTAPDAPKAWA